ncbi:MAG: domain containing protein, partial [Bacteroidota bacterium]|nr:domain containing protein [Bacteroidota bacterium]
LQGAVLPYSFGSPLGPEVMNGHIYYSTKAGIKYSWSTGDTTEVITKNPNQTSVYTVIVYDTSGCRNQDTLAVAVIPSPTVYAGPDTALCKGVTYTMPATSTSTSITWTPNTGLNADNILNPVFNYNQTISYVLTATGGNGCRTSDSVTISISAPSVYPGHDTSLCQGETYVIPASSSTQNIFWSPVTGLTDSTSINPTFNLTESMTYVLTATDSNGCKVSDSVKITVIECADLSVPNAFTPGAANNDHFTVFGHVAEYQIRIFNRWGQEVYASNDLNELNQLGRGWDGTFKGKIQDTGTFVYFIAAKDFNGKSVTKKGNLTLIR